MIRLLLLALVVVGTPARADVAVERISFDRARDGVVVRVQTSERVRAYSVDQSEGQLELVLYRAELAPALERPEARGPVRSYEVGDDGDRVVFAFDADPGYNVRAYPDLDSDDLLLSFSRTPRPRRQSWGGGVASPVRRVDPAPPTTSAGPIPGGERQPVDGTENWSLDTIVLDAGHGGRDAGGVGVNGVTDRDVAFAVVNLLGPMIERELGVRVVYTREADVFVGVRERGRIANREGGKLFISVHGNAAANASAYGTETFFLAPRGQGNAREVMERENGVIEMESDPSLYADFYDEGDILASLAMSAYQEESQLLARLIEDEFVDAGRRSRGVKQDNFAVLWAASMPAVLVEVGFVTNPEEARYLASEAGQLETARAIFEAVRAYKQTYERGLSSAQAD
ncbi:MAG: N-acetylmuramoyl-L-alanine amidase [Bacteroidota bacterium]